MVQGTGFAARIGLVLGAVLGAAYGAAPAAAQTPVGVLAGRVTDEQTGEPLALARVEVVEAHRAELAAEDGSFRFVRLPAGRYTVEIEQLGYDRHVQEVEVRADATTEILTALHVRAIELSEIVVTGALTRRAGQDVMSPVSVMSGAELDRRLSTTVAGTLESEPGLAVSSIGPVTGRPVLRGLGGDRILILEDGMRPGDMSSTSGDHAVAIDVVNAKRFEIVRGPMSLLYGSSALGGVVNVVSEEIPTSRTGQAHGTLTTQGETGNDSFTAGGFVTAGLGPLALRAEGSVRRSGDVATPVGDLVNTGARTFSGALGGATIGPWGHAGAAYRFFDTHYGIPGGFVGGHERGVDIEMRRHSFRGEAERHYEEERFVNTLRAAGSYTYYNHVELEQSGNVGTEYTQNMSNLDLLARHGVAGPLALGAVGVQAHYRDIQTGGSLRTPSMYDLALAAFLVEEIGTGRLRLQLGARYDWAHYVPRDTTAFIFAGGQRIPVRPRTFGAVSGSAGLLFAATNAVRLGTSVSRAYRTPDFNELYSNGPHLAANSYDVGDPSLGRETGLGVDAFVRVTTEGFTAELAGFSNWLNDYVFPSSRGRAELGTQGGRPRFQYTNENTRFVGAEGEAQVSLGGAWVAEATASYVRAHFTSERASVPIIQGTDATFVTASPYPPLIPPLNGRVGLRYENPRVFGGVSMRWAAAQERLGDFETRTPEYVTGTLDVGVRRLIGGRFHTLTSRVENVTDTEYRDHLSRIKDIMPQPGRNFVLMYRLSF